MTYSIRELREAPDNELIERHDALAETTVAGINYYLAELARRDQGMAAISMLRFTRAITRLTWVICGLTVVYVLLTALVLSD